MRIRRMLGAMLCVLAVTMLCGCEEWTYLFHAAACLESDYLLNGTNEEILLNAYGRKGEKKITYAIKKLEIGDEPFISGDVGPNKDLANPVPENKGEQKPDPDRKPLKIGLRLTKAQQLRTCFLMTEFMRAANLARNGENAELALMEKIEKQLREKMPDSANRQAPENKIIGLDISSIFNYADPETKDEPITVSNEQQLVSLILLVNYVRDGSHGDQILPVFERCKANAATLELVQDSNGTLFSVYLRAREGFVLETLPLTLTKEQLVRIARTHSSKGLENQCRADDPL